MYVHHAQGHAQAGDNAAAHHDNAYLIYAAESDVLLVVLTSIHLTDGVQGVSRCSCSSAVIQAVCLSGGGYSTGWVAVFGASTVMLIQAD